MAANYPYRIASIGERNAGLPPVLFDVLNLDRVIEADTAIQEADLRIAEGLVDGLKGARGGHPRGRGIACADPPKRRPASASHCGGNTKRTEPRRGHTLRP